MRTVGIYVDGLNHLASMLSWDLKQRKISSHSTICICELIEPIEKYGLEEKVIIIHPSSSNSDNCWGKIKRIIEMHPQKQFYVFAYDTPEREEEIGVHKNLTYISFRNVKEALSEIVKNAQQ